LIKILNDSIKAFPRNYLFESNLKTGIKDDTFLKYLRNITFIKHLNVDMMRSIYITHFYNKNKTYKARDDLALKMRHSTITASKNYYKVSQDVEPNKEIEELKQQNVKLTLRIKELEDQINNLTNNKDDKQMEKMKKDIIYKANNKNIKPKESTMSKYGIKFNSETNKYY